MSSIICPTVLASEPHEYRAQIDRLEPFARRIQIDLTDGVFTKSRTIHPIQSYIPDGIEADIHMMFERPSEHTETLVSLQPHMVILHAEASDDVAAILDHLKKFDMKVGIALLQDTDPEKVSELIELSDHVLIFSGSLGSFGGTADMSLLNKVSLINAIKPGIEIGWDGGASLENVAELARGGVNVINVGGAMHTEDSPEIAYQKLVAAVQS